MADTSHMPVSFAISVMSAKPSGGSGATFVAASGATTR